MFKFSDEKGSSNVPLWKIRSKVRKLVAGPGVYIAMSA